MTHDLGRDPVALEISNQGAPRGFDVLGRLDDAPRVDADVGDVHERVRGGAGDEVGLDGLGARGRHLGVFRVLFRRVGAEGTEDGWMEGGGSVGVRPWETRYPRREVNKERTMTSCPVDDLFEQDARFAVVVETETKHARLVQGSG